MLTPTSPLPGYGCRLGGDPNALVDNPRAGDAAQDGQWGVTIALIRYGRASAAGNKEAGGRAGPIGNVKLTMRGMACQHDQCNTIKEEFREKIVREKLEAGQT